jgi:hypothetical protein
VNAAASCVVLVVLAGCEPQGASLADAAPVDTAPSAPASVASAAPSEAHARMAHWDEARVSALQVPCRAIAVDGPVRVTRGGSERAADRGLERAADRAGSERAADRAGSERAADRGDASAPDDDAGAPLALEGQIPSEAWLSLAPDARLVAKDPRTTRETAFLGPARVRACVDHREESWLAAGRFESAIGAGETPGAEEWVVTPLGIVRYLAAKVSVDVHARDARVALGSGVAFLWLPDDVHEGRSSPASPGPASHPGLPGDAGASDAGHPVAATTVVDDDGWLRMSEGALDVSATRPATLRETDRAARASVDQCVALEKRARALATELLSGPIAADGRTAKDQMKTRRIARAACAVASLRVDMLGPAGPRAEMAARLEESRVAGGAPPAPSSPP